MYHIFKCLTTFLNFKNLQIHRLQVSKYLFWIYCCIQETRHIINIWLVISILFFCWVSECNVRWNMCALDEKSKYTPSQTICHRFIALIEFACKLEIHELNTPKHIHQKKKKRRKNEMLINDSNQFCHY